MDDALDKKLVETFPNLYKDRKASMRETCMCWGFEVGDGWKDLIWKASEKIEVEILKQPEDKREFYKASQVKEKFGTLRFYMTGETEAMSKVIEEAETTSGKTCEICVKPGEVMSQGGSPFGWLKCVCKEHSEGYGQIGHE